MVLREPKLCLLGDSGVGKTALAERLGASRAPRADGLWIHRWRRPDNGVEYALWDLRGRSLLDSLGQSFLAHADGLALIADAGRPESIALALQAGRIASLLIGERPQVLILNRFGDADPPSTDALPADIPDDLPIFAVSPGSGAGVVEAFSALADMIGARGDAA
ncbi:MAG: GTPase domain-containing protein [Lysobacteraceae bacterium]